jgi:hypothetical protein
LLIRPKNNYPNLKNTNFLFPKPKRADWLGGFGIIIKPKPNRSERQAKSAAGADEAV